MIRKVYIILLMAAFFLTACDESRVFEKNYDITEGNWYIDSVLKFQFEISDTSIPYNLLYNIRNTNAYPYYNMYVSYYLEDSTGTIVSQQLQNINLLDPKTGQPYGNGLGDIYEHQLLAIPNYKFKQKGKYTFKIKQYMRENPLPNILTMGLRIDKVLPE